jgi:peroxiredoxin
MAQLSIGDPAPSFALVDRHSFLVGPDGRIERAWYRVRPEDTVPTALEALGAS